MRAMYLSKRDCLGYFERAIESKITPTLGVQWMVCYACSNNKHKVWDLTETIEKLGYSPKDDGEVYFV